MSMKHCQLIPLNKQEDDMKLSEEQLQEILQTLAGKKQFNPEYMTVLREELKRANTGNSGSESTNFPDYGSFLPTLESS